MNRKKVKLLEAFRDIKLSKEELLEKLNVKSLNDVKQVVIIASVDVIKLLESFKAGDISETELLEWVNTIWFSDTYDYVDEEMDSIASVMNKLEEIDEGRELDEASIDLFIKSLKANEEIEL